jgi:hypothetical protein
VRFGSDRQLDEFPRRKLFRRRLISKFEFSHAVVSTPMPSAVIRVSVFDVLETREGRRSQRHDMRR